MAAGERTVACQGALCHHESGVARGLVFVTLDSLDGQMRPPGIQPRLGLPRDEGVSTVVAAVPVDRGVVEGRLGEVAGVAGHLAPPPLVLLLDGNLVLQLPARGSPRHGIDGCVRGDMLVGSLGRCLGLRGCLLGLFLIRSLFRTVQFREDGHVDC